VAYVCPTCGRVTAERRPCSGTEGDPHGLRDPVRSDELSDALVLDPPRATVRHPKPR
jgi:hypothetical protein